MTRKPCLNRCTHNTGPDICRGCGLTVAESRDWASYTDQEKAEIVKLAADRKSFWDYYSAKAKEKLEGREQGSLIAKAAELMKEELENENARTDVQS